MLYAGRLADGKGVATSLTSVFLHQSVASQGQVLADFVGKVAQASPFCPNIAATPDGKQVWFTLKDTGKTQVFDAQPPFEARQFCRKSASGTWDTVMGYFDGNTVTALWNYAQYFSMSDNSWDTTFGPSTPGALNLISGQTHGVIAVEQTSMHCVQPTFCERAWAQIEALYAKYFGFSNSPTIAASSATAFACAIGSAPGAR